MQSTAAVLAAVLLGTGAALFLRAALQADQALLPDAPLPDGAVARMGSTRLRHGDAVSFAAYTPDGKSLVTAGRDQMVRLWDLATGQEIRRFAWGEAEHPGNSEAGEDGVVQRREQQFWHETAWSCQAALSADGKLVAASRGGLVCLWETATGTRLRQLQTGQKRLLQLAFAADGRTLLTLGPGQATALWEVATGACIRRTAARPTYDFFSPIALLENHNVLVSPGFKYLAWSSRDNNGICWIGLRDLASDRELTPIRVLPGVMTLAFSADDKSLLLEYQEAGIVIADVATGKELRRLKPIGRNDSPTSMDSVLAIALSSDGTRLAVSWMSNTLELWDLKSGRHLLPAGKVTGATYEQHSTNWLNFFVRPALAFSPDGQKLVWSPGGAAVRQFSCATGAEISVPGDGQRAPVTTLALSADGSTLWSYGPGDPVRCWDWRTGKETGQRAVQASAVQAAFAADGDFAYVADQVVTIVSREAKNAGKIAFGDHSQDALALSPDGAVLATRTWLRPEIHLWDTRTLKERHTLGRTDPGSTGGATTETTGVLLTELVFSPDGRCLAAAGRNRQLCLWDVATGALRWELPLRAGQAIERFAFSPNGRVLAAIQADRTVALYEVVSGALRARLGEADPKNGRVYLTDGSWSPLDIVQMRRDPPVCLACSPDGRYLALAQHTPAIHVWDIRAGREVGQLSGHAGGVVSLLFAPDGTHLFSGGTDTTVLTWDLTHLIHPDPANESALPAQALEALLTDLEGNDAGRAFAAMRKLSAVPQQTLALLKDRMHPATPADPKQLARLLVDLQSDRFARRQQAQSELEGLGELAAPALRQALAANPPLDLRQRLERLLDTRSAPGPRTGVLRGFRAVELLEGIGSAEARELLKALASGASEARLTEEATSALQRLTKRS
jgi:WD40 repeat protein